MVGKKNNRPQNHLVWMDLEMTGLDVETCVILQAAIVVTDMKLNVLASKEITIWQPEPALATMVPFVRDMHTHNSLLKKVRSSQYCLADAQAQIMEVLTKYVPYNYGFLAGSSIHVDRKFVDKYMPSVSEYLHYRMVDVSSIKIMCKSWCGENAKRMQKESNHTALEDVLGSIEELKHFRDNCFKLAVE